MKTVKIYRVHYMRAGQSLGFTYHPTRKAAMNEITTMPAVESYVSKYDFPPTTTGFIRALQRLASHPDNG